MPSIISITLVNVLLLAEEVSSRKTVFAKSLQLFIAQFNHTLGQAKGAIKDRNLQAVIILQLFF